MTIIMFLVDTSASMNQRTFLGTTLLDIAKNSIETFQKIRSKNPSSKMDRLMLLSYDEPPGNIKAGWKETHSEFATQLKNLKAQGVTEIGPAIKNAFDMLNMNRNQSGIDTYGQGRCPFYIEPALIICFTDGESMVTPSGIQKQLVLPMGNGLVGSELTKEPFRWDQRVFGVVLKMPAVEIPEQQSETTFIPSAENSPIDSMCEVTGGRSYLVSSPRQLNQTLESLAQKSAMHGVVVNFEHVESPLSNHEEQSRPSTPSQANSWKSTKRMIYVKTSVQRGHSVGHWPIPESYWPDAKSKSLPPRDAQPYIKFSTPFAPPAAHQMNNLPIDVYELEPSPLTQHILKNKTNQCYQTFVSQSSKYSEHPFGFLQANHNNQKVVLHVMPYNYPVLLSLLDDLQKVSMKITPKWKGEFDNYLRAMPGYYAPYLRRALGRMGVHGVVPESLDSCLSFMVVSHLKQIRFKAKQEYDSLVASVGQGAPPAEFIQVINKNASSILNRQDFKDLLKFTGGDYSSLASLQKELVNYESFPIAVPCPANTNHKILNYRNPYDISRKDLLSQVSKLRATLLQPSGLAGSLLKNEHLHHLPIQSMGNYHEYLAKAPQPLRKLDTQPERLHTFGNPFKVNKNLMIDEADEAMPGMNMPGSSSPKRSKREASEPLPNSPAKKKRKPGPLPRHITLTNRPVTPPITAQSPLTPPSSPFSPTPSQSPSSPSQSPVHLSNGDEPEIAELGSKNNSTSGTTIQAKRDSNGIVLPKHNGLSHTKLSSTDAPTSPTQFNAKVIHSTNRSDSVEEGTPALPNGVDHYNRNLLKSVLLKAVKRPGKDFSRLFEELKNLKGSLQQKLPILDLVIYESHRFKRSSLIDLLMKYKNSLINQQSLSATTSSSTSSNTSSNTSSLSNGAMDCKLPQASVDGKESKSKTIELISKSNSRTMQQKGKT